MIRFITSFLAFLGFLGSAALTTGEIRKLVGSDFEQVGDTIYGQVRSNQTLTTRFGDSLAISSDGLRMAVGAPGHDDTTSGAGGNGGIFVYDLNPSTSAWEQSATYVGSPGEGLGARFAMSASGTRLAVRRNPGTNTSYVTVHDTLSKQQLGGAISGCSFTAYAVSISPDGNRVAVSCENFSPIGLGNAGKVDLYEWTSSSSTWESLGSITGTAAQSLFSWATAFDLSGSRLAVSAPLYNGTSTTRYGSVYVYELNTGATNWTQVGDRLSGGVHLERFGLSLALSENGATLVVASPTASAGAGSVSMFQFVNAVWQPKGQVVLGQAGENFGQSLCISGDGSRFAASAPLANNSTGLARLYEYQTQSGTWIQVNGDLQSLSPGDKLGFRQKGIALTTDGLRIAVGADNGRFGSFQTGHARVFNAVPSPSASPSQAPTVVTTNPTRAPTTIPITQITNPTHPPGVVTANPGDPPEVLTSSPTSSTSSPAQPQTTMPTVALTKFDWHLERVGNVTAVFTKDTEEDEIKLMYSISHRTAVVKILDINCTNPVEPHVVSTSQSKEVTAPTLSQLNVVLDINQTSVMSSSIWRNGNTIDNGKIELCVRVDLVMGDAIQTSVNFHEQKLFLSVGLSQGFSITQIDLDRDAADIDDEDAVVDFGITSCQCNAARQCVSDVLVQGDDVFICVFAPIDRTIEIAAVEELDFSQGSLVIAAVNNSSPDALTAVFLFGKSALIRSQLRSELFDANSPANLTASGEVSVRFGGGTRRSLRFGVGNTGNQDERSGSRKMQVQSKDEVAGFSVRMALAPINSTSKHPTGADKTGVIIGSVIGGVVGIALILALLIARRRQKKAEEEDEMEGVSVARA